MIEKQQPYKYRVYEEIKGSILSGEYVPGSILNERRLSNEMGISRTPVREALQMLAQDGWLQTETYKGMIVREFDIKYMHDMLQIRTALEILAVENAVQNITDEKIRKLEAIQKKQTDLLERYEDNQCILIDREFHSRIYEMSGNTELIQLLSNYYDMFRFLGMQAVCGSEERRGTTLLEHKAILNALKERSRDQVVEAMQLHMEETEKNIMIRGQMAPEKTMK